MAIYLVDFENVHDSGLVGITDLSDKDEVCIFYSEKSEHMTFESHVNIMRTPARVKYIKLRRSAKNYLDFQLCTHLGYIIGSGHEGGYYIISKDNGYQSVIDYWKDHNVKVIRQPSIGYVFNPNRQMGQNPQLPSLPAIVILQENNQILDTPQRFDFSIASSKSETYVDDNAPEASEETTAEDTVLASDAIMTAPVEVESVSDNTSIDEASVKIDESPADKTYKSRKKGKKTSSRSNAKAGNYVADKGTDTKDASAIDPSASSEGIMDIENAADAESVNSDANDIIIEMMSANEEAVSSKEPTSLSKADTVNTVLDEQISAVQVTDEQAATMLLVEEQDITKKLSDDYTVTELVSDEQSASELISDKHSTAEHISDAQAVTELVSDAQVVNEQLSIEQLGTVPAVSAEKTAETKKGSAKQGSTSRRKSTRTSKKTVQSDNKKEAAPTATLPEAYRKRVRTILKGQDIPSAHYTIIYKALASSYDKLALNNLMVKAFGSSKGGVVYKMIKDIFTDYQGKQQ